MHKRSPSDVSLSPQMLLAVFKVVRRRWESPSKKPLRAGPSLWQPGNLKDGFGESVQYTVGLPGHNAVEGVVFSAVFSGLPSSKHSLSCMQFCWTVCFFLIGCSSLSLEHQPHSVLTPRTPNQHRCRSSVTTGLDKRRNHSPPVQKQGDQGSTDPVPQYLCAGVTRRPSDIDPLIACSQPARPPGEGIRQNQKS